MVARSRSRLAVSEGFRSFVLDQLQELGEVVPRAMFGGIGLYRHDLFFGILARDVLYLRADDETRPGFEAAGSRPFRPYAGRSESMRYYSVPVSVLESTPELTRWGRLALAAAARSTGETRPRKRKA
jgi:DNA transformation protein and related proteins